MRARHRIAIGGGLLALAGKVIRIGHLGTQAQPETMQRAHQEMDVIERLSDRIVGDIADRISKP